MKLVTFAQGQQERIGVLSEKTPEQLIEISGALEWLSTLPSTQAHGATGGGDSRDYPRDMLELIRHEDEWMPQLRELLRLEADAWDVGESDPAVFDHCIIGKAAG